MKLLESQVSKQMNLNKYYWVNKKKQVAEKWNLPQFVVSSKQSNGKVYA